MARAKILQQRRVFSFLEWTGNILKGRQKKLTILTVQRFGVRKVARSFNTKYKLKHFHRNGKKELIDQRKILTFDGITIYSAACSLLGANRRQ